MTESEDRTIDVLLVDDEEELVSLLAQRLKRRGMNVVTTNSGPEALAVCELRRFDVAIVDLKMPGMDGVEVMQRLKVIQPFLQAVMFTGHGGTESALEAGKLDAFRYVMKPSPFEDLLAIIEDAYRHKRSQLRREFQREMQAVTRHASTAGEILEAGERLRQKYEQD